MKLLQSIDLIFLLRSFCFISVFILNTFTLRSQNFYEPLNHTLRDVNGLPRILSEIDTCSVNTFKPNTYEIVNGNWKLKYRSYLPVTAYDSTVFLNRKYKKYSWIRRKLLYENFVIIDTGNLYITIDPLLNLSGGREVGDAVEATGVNHRNVFNNTRGLLIRASIGKKFSIETYAYENQAKFPTYIDDFVENTGVVPGQGRVKDFKDDSFDFSQSGAYFSYAPWKVFDFQFGHHKHFIGDGYRSLILSDNAFNYPFLRLNLHSVNRKWHYSVLYAGMQDLVRLESDALNEGVFRKKGASFHLLEYKIKERLRIYITQGTMWPMENSNGDVSFNSAILNPVILVQPVFNGMDGKNNSILGGGFSAGITKRIEFYGQMVAGDDNFRNLGIQSGIKIYPLKTAFIQVESNIVNSSVYSSVSDEYDNGFVHYNQPLAQVLYEDFQEVVIRAAYRFKRLIPEFQMNYSDRKFNDSNVLFIRFEMAYILNPANNLKLFASLTERTISNGTTDESERLSLFNFGIKTDLRNIYYDF